jgi:hypothetical protein
VVLPYHTAVVQQAQTKSLAVHACSTSLNHNKVLLEQFVTPAVLLQKADNS